jgi:subtilase family serine protease
MPSSSAPPPVVKQRRELPTWLLPTSLVVIIVLVAGGLYAFLATHQQSSSTTAAATGASTTVVGIVPPAEKDAQDLGEAPANQPLHITVALPLNNQPELRAILAGLNDPHSPYYHKYLTPEQFLAQFGVTPAQLQTIASVLGGLGLALSNIKVDANSGIITFDTTVATAEALLHIHIHNFKLHGKTYYGPINDPTVPTALAGLISFIGGLDDFSAPVAHFARLAPRLHPGADGYLPSQLQQAYGATALINQGDDGSGQSIGFVELADYSDADIQAYQQQNNLSGGTFTRVPVDGGGNLADGASEVELDMEVAFAIAPKVHEVVYEGPNPDMLDVYLAIVNDPNAPHIISTSWGQCEELAGPAYMGQEDRIIEQGALEGISFFAAAGDSGAFDCGDTNLGVDSPASDQYVTGVGGTSLTLASDGSYASETGWSCATCQGRGPNGVGGGGGISQTYSLPDYQVGLNPQEAQGNTAYRFVPDVAADADPRTGYDVICTVSQDPYCQHTDNGHLPAGGTSAAAPLWAAGMVLVNQALAKENYSQVLGGANTILYSVAQGASGALHDVTQGDNLHYHALPGYDLATGLGSPDFSNLAAAIPSISTSIGGPTAQDLLANGTFELGGTPWQEKSAGSYQLISTIQPYQGRYGAYLCGYVSCSDQLWQTFQVPSSFTRLTLSYFWELASAKKDNACDDTFTVTINTVNGATLGAPVTQALHACNAQATSDYAFFSQNITSALQKSGGQTLALVFSMTTNNQASLSEALVDNVAIEAQ